jgi:aspartate/methionine/tyrosine aminotransferase
VRGNGGWGHWIVEWQGEVKKEILKAEAEIAKLSVPCTTVAAQAAANTALEPRAATEFRKAMRRVRTAYAALGDSPGGPPFQAQVPVVEALIQRVKDLAAEQKWDYVNETPRRIGWGDNPSDQIPP